MQNFDAVSDHLVTHNPLDIRNHADAAGVVLLVCVIQPCVCYVSEMRALSFSGGGNLTTASA